MISLALMLFAAPVGGTTTFTTGNDLHSFCQGKGTDACIAYVSGAYDGMIMESGKLGAGVCIHEAVTLSQVKDVFVLYLAAHPEARHKSGSWLVRQSLREAFPCLKR